MNWLGMCAAMLLLSLTGCYAFARGGRETVRELREFGRISLPQRLENRNPSETATHAEFTFERASGSFLLIGSHTPIVEKLAVGAWAAPSEGPESAKEAVLYRMPHQRIRWRREGAYEIGEGVQEVNTHEFPAWVVIRDAPERNLTVAYMVWKKESSLAKARALVDAALQSFQAGLPVREYLAEAAKRAQAQ